MKQYTPEELERLEDQEVRALIAREGRMLPGTYRIIQGQFVHQSQPHHSRPGTENYGEAHYDIEGTATPMVLDFRAASDRVLDMRKVR